MVDHLAAEEWIRMHERPIGPIERVRERPWSTVLRVPVTRGVVWVKACAALQAFEARLTADLSIRWPDRVVEVIAFDAQRNWLLLADAGMQVSMLGDPLGAWLIALPLYGELQRGEVAFANS